MIRHRIVFALALCFSPACSCASGAPLRDGGGEGGRPDASMLDTGVMPVDLGGVDADVDMGRGDAGPLAMTCQTCATDADCAAGYCARLVVGGMACLPGCDPDLPTCPRRFTCIYDASGTGVAAHICAPVGGPCCVDEDGDGYGVGVGCMGPDCNDTDANVHPGRDEICDGLDTNCDGMVDEAPNDCISGRCSPHGTGTYQSITSGVCTAATCTSGTTADCGLYTCSGGGAMGTSCATTCAVATVDTDTYCIDAAHCDTGTCVGDVPSGGTCDEDSDCTSSHCDNGFCCGSGTCCSAVADCPGGGASTSLCEDPSTCQGARGMGQCNSSFQCVTMSGIPDDTACDTMTVARDCGLYIPVMCTGMATQPTTPRTCPTSCTTDGDCILAAHCSVGICIPDLPAGGPCGRTADCVTGLSCTDNVCCTTACSGTCESCNLPGFAGMCMPITRGADPSGECNGYSCAGYYGGFAPPMPNVCQRRDDVSDAQSACDGTSACISPDVACPAQPLGPVQTMCDLMCQSPMSGTCTGTTAGGCTNLDNPAMTSTCGLGVCAHTVQACTGGMPTMCTPGTPVAESCNGMDDNCNGSVDDGPITSLCPPPSGAMTTSCGGAAGCSVAMCMAGFLDMDLSYANGCECNVGTSGTTCSTAIGLGPVAAGGTVNQPGNIPPGGDRWYSVSFPIGPRPGAGNPTISVTPAASFTMAIQNTCTSGDLLGCMDAPTSGAVTTYAFADNVAATAFSTNGTPWPTMVFIHVTRNSAATDCASTQFNLSVTR